MNIDQLEEKFHCLAGIGKLIMNLDFEEESFLEQLEYLQDKQKEMRVEIDEIWQQTSLSEREALRPVIQECIELEAKVKVKLEQHQASIANIIHELNSAKMARNRYQKEYSQSEGYFIDNHR